MKFNCAMQVFVLAVFAQLCSGREVEDASGLRGSFRASAGPARRAILDELEEVLGRSHREETEHQLHKLEEELNVTFKALAKNDQGAIDAPSARYALHRFFVQRYGWQIKGLETEGGTWDSESPVQAMGDRVPEEMRELFEERLGHSGLTLHELAVVAATMDRMLHIDVSRKLHGIYLDEKIPQDSLVNSEYAIEIMYFYIAKFFMLLPPGAPAKSFGIVRLPRSHHDLLVQSMDKIVPDSPFTRQYSLDLIAKVLAVFGEQIGHLENRQCQAMKAALVKLEHRPGSGRVRLGDFFQKKDANFEFGESAEFLRAAGALDESNPEDPKVMIPNYLTSSSNCLSPSDYFEICCFDDCEELMDQIEAKLEAPVALPEEIVSVVSPLSSRPLPAQLVDLLQQAARHHGGLVPIHGRLFAQWMHQAYPRQCNHPRSTQDKQQASYSGTPEAAMMASAKEKALYAKVARAMEVSDNQDTPAEEYVPLSLWTMDEQLVSTKAHQPYARLVFMREILAHAFLGVGGMGAIKLFFFFNGHRSMKSNNMKLM